MIDLRIKTVVKAIAVPVAEWPGNCSAISDMVLKAGLVPGGRLRYGHYLGPVVSGTMFSARGPIIPHGWIDYDDKELNALTVVDPTRWVFEAKKPYIYHAPDFDGYYDIGGNAWRAYDMLSREVPYFDPDDCPIRVPEEGPISETVRSILGDHFSETGEISFRQLGYIGNMPPTLLCGHAYEVYQWLIDIGHGVIIPSDNRQLIMEG